MGSAEDGGCADGCWTFNLLGSEWQRVEYKYMLGPPWDWSHAETWADDNYRANRDMVMRSDVPMQHDRVEAWLQVP